MKRTNREALENNETIKTERKLSELSKIIDSRIVEQESVVGALALGMFFNTSRATKINDSSKH